MWPVHLYHLALEKILATPLQLSEHDFDVLRSFNPADEGRGRGALRRAQLALLPKAETPVKTVTPAPAAPTPSGLTPAQLVLKFGEALRPVLESYQRGLKEHKQQIQELQTEVAALEALKKKIADLEEQMRQHQASVTTLRADHQALGTVVIAGMEPYRAPTSRDPRGITH